MNDSALIIFVRNPELGKVKTRIAATLGEVAALSIYKKLLQHTHDISVAFDCDRYVFYSNYAELNDTWENDLFNKFLQEGLSLGDKMKNAFKRLFNNGYKKVCIIGSDCLELNVDIIRQAYTALDNHEVVFGPAADGGYYLLGMCRLHACLFEDKEWSTDEVLKQSIADLEKNNITYTLLSILNDVDTANDVPVEWKTTHLAG